MIVVIGYLVAVYALCRLTEMLVMNIGRAQAEFREHQSRWVFMTGVCVVGILVVLGLVGCLLVIDVKMSTNIAKLKGF